MRWAGNLYRKRNCVIVSSAVITIQAHRLRHSPRGELLAEKGLNSDWNSCGESCIAHYFQSITDFRGNQFTVHTSIASYVEVEYEGFYCNIIIFLIYNITYLLKSRREHENKTHKYMFSWLSTGVKTADVNDLSQRRVGARHTSSVLWAWSANRLTPASSLTAGLLRRGNETHCREAAADPLDTTSNLGAGLPEFALSQRGHPYDQG